MSLQARKPLQLDLPRDGHAAALVRAALAEIPGPTEALGHRLALLATELVTNAVRHGVGQIRFLARFENAIVRVEVRDDGGGFDLERSLAIEGTAAGGFGLKIVDRMADRWGADASRGLVWFELDLA
ncbi:MAG: ATP-binding protein [Solirubrobacterales bacterium]|nr:ATP-binding protein [Solirubrobacterales bacterium]